MSACVRPDLDSRIRGERAQLIHSHQPMSGVLPEERVRVSEETWADVDSCRHLKLLEEFRQEGRLIFSPVVEGEHSELWRRLVAAEPTDEFGHCQEGVAASLQ